MMSLKDVILRIPTNKLWSESNKKKFTIININIFTTEYLKQYILVIVHHWHNDEDVVMQTYTVIGMPDQSSEDSHLSQHTSQTLLQVYECSKHLFSKMVDLNSRLW